MTLETSNDRAGFLADFGSDVTGAASFRAIFDHQYIEAGDIIGRKPLLVAAEVSPVTSLTRGDVLTVEDQSYTVIRLEPDGTGWTLIILEGP